MLEQRTSAKYGPVERGASAVEFALILPVLLTIVFGLIEFGFVFNAQISLAQATREGVRVAAVDAEADVAAMEQRMRDAFLGFVGEPDAGPTSNACDPDDGDPQLARLSGSVDHFQTPIFRVGGFDLSSEAVMRCGG